MSRRTLVVVALAAATAGLGVPLIFATVGRGWVYLVLGIGPGLLATIAMVLARVEARYVLTWSLPLIVCQLGALVLCPLPLNYVLWFAGFGIFLLMVFSEKANVWWASRIDTLWS